MIDEINTGLACGADVSAVLALQYFVLVSGRLLGVVKMALARSLKIRLNVSPLK